MSSGMYELAYARFIILLHIYYLDDSSATSVACMIMQIVSIQKRSQFGIIFGVIFNVFPTCVQNLSRI